jgi:hypothetical protein
VKSARTYHLTHRTGWRDPLGDLKWERKFYARHPMAAVKLLSVFWASLSSNDLIPAAGRITSLPALAAAASSECSAAYEEIRRSIHRSVRPRATFDERYAE